MANEKNKTPVELSKKEFIELIAEAVKTSLKELGIGKAEKNHLINPELEQKDAEAYNKLSPSAKAKEFIKALIFKDTEVVKALGGTPDSAGGYLLPIEFRQEIIKELPNAAIIRKYATVIPAKTRVIEIPKVLTKPTYSWGAENTAFNESEPTFDQVRFTLNRLDIFTAVSKELLADAGVDVAKLLKQLFVEQYAEAEDLAFTEGDGSNKPLGYNKETKITSIEATGGSSEPLSYDDVVKLFQSLPFKYRAKAIFITSPRGMELLRKVRDGVGNPIFTDVRALELPSIFGRPVIENIHQVDELVDPDGTPNSGDEYYAVSIYFGDFSNYYIVDALEFGIEVTDQGDAFKYNQYWFKAYNRIDGKVVLPQAFRKLIVKVTA